MYIYIYIHKSNPFCSVYVYGILYMVDGRWYMVYGICICICIYVYIFIVVYYALSDN